MTISGFVLLGGLWTGCGSSPSQTSDAGGTTGNTTGSSTGSGGDAGSTADAGGATPSCQDYCAAIMQSCTGANQQYSAVEQCLASCKAMPVGASADTSGNTLGCRIYHAGAAKTAPATHCVHAGPGGAGMCGSDCAGYCQIAMMYCTPANLDGGVVYTDLADCMSTCQSFPNDAGYNVGLQSGFEVGCLLFHVQEGSVVPMDHCLGDLAKAPPDLSATCHN